MELGRSMAVPGALIVSVILALFLFWVTGQFNYTVPIQNNTIGNEVSHSEIQSRQGVIVSAVTDWLLKTFATKKDIGELVPASKNLKDTVNEALETKTFAPSGCEINTGFPQQIRNWCGLISTIANESGIDPDLLASLIWQESGGNPDAYSSNGAVGLMQVMPRDGIAANFQCLDGPCFQNRPTIGQLSDPEFNVRYGAKLLSNLITEHGSIREALKFYGPIGVGYYYADKVLAIYRQYNH